MITSVPNANALFEAIREFVEALESRHESTREQLCYFVILPPTIRHPIWIFVGMPAADCGKSTSCSPGDKQNEESRLFGLRNRLFDVLIDKRFENVDLKDICFRGGVDWENLSGETKRDKARELILSLEKHDQLDRLVELIKKVRPDAVTWLK